MSPLPANGTAWPLGEGTAARYRGMDVREAYWSGEIDRVQALSGGPQSVMTGGPGTTLNPQGSRAERIVGGIRRFFTARSSANTEADTRRLLPMAEDVANVISQLLFAEQPAVRILGNNDDEGEPDEATSDAQEHLESRLRSINWHAMLMTHGQHSAVFSYSALRIVFDKSAESPIRDRPVIRHEFPRNVIPVNRYGQQTAVIFHQVVASTRDKIWRHLEIHEDGAIIHGLYEGTGDSIGERRALSAQPVTAPLERLVDANGVQRLLPPGSGYRTAVAPPNLLPDPGDPRSLVGRSSLTPAFLAFIDDASEVYTQMMDELREAKGRIFASRAVLENGGPGKGMSLDLNQRVFQKLNLPPEAGNAGSGLPIEVVQFAMRVEQYLLAMEAIEQRALKAAGLNPQTMGDSGDVTQTATEYSGKNKRSLATRDAMVLYQQSALSDLLTAYLALDVQEFAPRVNGRPVQAFPVVVEFPEAVQPTLLELATTAKVIAETGAATLRSLIQDLRPGWSERRVREEAEELEAKARQQLTIDPSSFGAAPVPTQAGGQEPAAPAGEE